MIYRKKAGLLLALVVVLTIVYVLSIVFDPANRQSKAFAWLDTQLINMADRIEVYGINGDVELVRKNNVWFSADEKPVKQGRVNDLFVALSKKQAYPERASSSEARGRLGLNAENASRIVVKGGAGLPLLDLLVGNGDALKKEIYLRRAESNTIYSGDDLFSYFTDANPSTWYDYHLFLEDPSKSDFLLGPGFSRIDSVQRVEIKTPGKDPYSFTRNGTAWTITPSVNEPLDGFLIDSWLRTVLEAAADSFGTIAPETIEANITLWFGDGSVKTIEAGPEDSENFRNLKISDSPYIYKISEWNFARLFREINYFFKLV